MYTQAWTFIAVGLVFGFILGLLVCDMGRADPFDEMRMNDSQLRNEMDLQEQRRRNYQQQQEFDNNIIKGYENSLRKNPC